MKIVPKDIMFFSDLENSMVETTRIVSIAFDEEKLEEKEEEIEKEIKKIGDLL